VCRDDSLRFSDAGTKTATKSAKRALAAKQALSSRPPLILLLGTG
jgi:hypothetical protein